jgi:hypothetical protein
VKPGEPPRGPFDEGVATRAPASVAFDLSYGKTSRLPTFKHPQNVNQLKAFLKFVEKQEKERKAYWAQRDAAHEARGKPSDHKNRRAELIWHYLKTANSDPEVAPAHHAMKEGEREMLRAAKPILIAGGKRGAEIMSKADPKQVRPLLKELSDGLIAQMNGPCNTYETLVRNYWDALRKVESGLAANYKSEFWHDRAVWEIREDMWTTWILYLLNPIKLLYMSADQSIGSEEGTLDQPEGGPEGEDPPN